MDAFFRVEHLLHRRYFFFDFPGSIRKLGSITSNKWTTYSGSNTTSPPQGLPLPLSGVLFENSVHHYQQADPFFWFEHHFPTAGDFFFHFPGGFQSPTLPHRRRLLLPLSGFCSRPSITSRTHSDFFFHFLGFVRKLTPITITNKWTTSSGSNTSSRSPATSSSTFRGLFANSVPSPASKDSQAPTKMAFYNTPEPSSPITGPNDFDSVYLPSGPGQDGDGDKPIPGGQDLTTATEIPGINTCMEVVVHAQAASLPLTEAQGALAPKKEKELRSGPNHGGGDCLTRATRARRGTRAARARRGISACVALPRWGRCGVACSRPSFCFRSLFRRLRRRSRGGHVAPLFLHKHRTCFETLAIVQIANMFGFSERCSLAVSTGRRLIVRNPVTRLHVPSLLLLTHLVQSLSASTSLSLARFWRQLS